MTQQLKRIDPLRTANVAALVYALVTGAFALILFPFIALMGFIAPSDGFGFAAPVFALFLVMIYPIFGGVMGWISGLLTALAYNLVVRWCGGLLLELESVPSGSGGPTA